MPNVEIYLCEKKHFAKKYKNKFIFDLHFFEPSPRGSKIKVCKDNDAEICKANKYCRDSYSEFFLKDFEPIECN